MSENDAECISTDKNDVPLERENTDADEHTKATDTDEISEKDGLETSPQEQPKALTNSITCSSVLSETVSAGKKESNMQFQGTVVMLNVKESFGYIKSMTPLPADYPQSKNVKFHLVKVTTGYLPLSAGDEVEFTLVEKKKNIPIASKLKMIKFKKRKAEEITKHLENTLNQFRALKDGKANAMDETSMNSHISSISEFLVTLLTCLPSWESAFNCSDLSADGVSLLLSFFLEIEQECKSLRKIFHSVMEILTHSKFFSIINGSFKCFVKNAVRDDDISSLRKVQNFLLMLLQYVPEKIRAVATLIKPMVHSESPFCAFLYSLLKESVKLVPGDLNDMTWEQLPLVPSVDELLSGHLEKETNLEPIKKKGSYTSAEEYTDIYFRLLRADCFHALKKGVHDMINGKLDPRDMYVYLDVSLEGIHISSTTNNVSLCLKAKPFTKVDDWIQAPNLMFGNLLCISVSGTFRDPIWATVTSRELLKSDGIVLVELLSEYNSINDTDVILSLCQSKSSTMMVESPTYYRAYQPVLKALQTMNPDNLPFYEELVNVNPQSSPPFTSGNTFDGQVVYRGCIQQNESISVDSFICESSSPDGSILDTSQFAALKSTLSRRLAIIQGPPGTGKTFIGKKLTELLLSMSPKPILPILVLTYKNHALDEFMKMLLSIYPDDIVRVGGRSQDPEVNRCNLTELKKATTLAETISKGILSLKREAEELKEELAEAFRCLSQAKQFDLPCFLNSVTVKQVSQLLLDCDWEKAVSKQEVEEMVSKVHSSVGDTDSPAAAYAWPEEMESLINTALLQWIPEKTTFDEVKKRHQVTSKDISKVFSSNESSNLELNFDEIETESEELERFAANMAPQDRERLLADTVFTDTHDVSSKAVMLPTLFDSADKIASEGTIGVLLNVKNLWKLDYEDRVNVIQLMLWKRLQSVGERFRKVLKAFHDVCCKKNELEDQHKVKIMKDRKVVGMTITGASIHHHLLEHLRPAVVIVEEAAEVLESQLIAVLGNWTKYLILIGDHKQLRPQVESHILARDYHMDISMMERLILNKFPYSTLHLQNRMLPEFADLLKDIYPELESNVTRVSLNQPAKCILYPSFFWDHESRETKGRSRVNEEEARRAINLALFLIQQGYDPGRITILAAYKAQTSRIRRKLKEAVKEHPYLFNQVESDEHKSNQSDNKVQVHTIDMYQGDENDFVIVSLVRSNETGDVGFLKSPNRRCVAQSRARCGLYFIGSAKTLCSNQHWDRLIQKLKENHRVGKAIPLYCPKHPDLTRVNAQQSKNIKIGGKFCKERCTFKMSCGKHQCIVECQPPHDHGKCRVMEKFTFSKCGHEGKKECYKDENQINCTKFVPMNFPACNHQTTVMCFEADNATCKERCPKKLGCGHPCDLNCGDTCKPEECKTCAKIREAEADRQRKAEEEKIKAAKREAEEEIKQIRKTSPKEVVSKRELYPTGDTASEYSDTENKVRMYIQAGNNWFPVIKKIEKVTNVHLQIQWLEEKQLLNDPTRNELKFHVIDEDKIEKVIKDGLGTSESSRQSYGAGIYFASDSSAHGEHIYDKRSNVLIACDVLVGKSFTIESAQDMTAEKLQDLGYDSLYVKRGTRETTGLLFDECVVYNPKQTIPKYVIHYEVTKYQDKDVVLFCMETNAVERNESMLTHNIEPKREMYNNELELHFRIAESQFLRLMQRSGKNYQIRSVDYYINPPLIRRFNKKAADMEAKYGDQPEAHYIWAFHGTESGNIEKIVTENFSLDKLGSSTGDKGYYGAGIYFSEFPWTSIGYGGGLLLCRVLPGKSYDCPKIMEGASLQPGFDSHIYGKDLAGRGEELVIFDPDQILPCYVINY